jgi:N-acetylglutamate synthase-like GNAT family acetyltransferase
MSSFLQLTTIKASNALDEISNFYATCNRKTMIDNDDIFVLAKQDNQIVGAVRLCLENGTYLLRTMQVREELQGQGFGRIILTEFEKLIQQMKVNEVLCMPYEHLEYFYGIIGFEKINLNESPEFLIDRLNNFHKKHSNQRVIIMRKLLS